MSNELISPDLVDVALNRVSGSVFEDFAIELLAALLGVDLIPLGGMHDGGADAVVEGLAEDAAQPRWFVQASVEQDTPGKIKRTVDRLRDVGRQPQRLTYVTSQVVKRVDLVERDLTLELDVDIHIRDAAYIRAHINDTPLTRAAFNNRLRSLTEFLRFPGSAPLITASKHVQSPAVYVFLRQEMDRRTGETSLVDAVADSLILWSLEGTDPDAGRFLTETEVAERIFAELPAAKALIAPVLRRRLEALADKSHPGGRVVRWHRKDDHFCLPFESRSRIEEENLADESLRLRVIAILEQRIRDLADEGLNEAEIRQGSEVALLAMQRTFEREGLEVAAFIDAQDDNIEPPTIADGIRDAMVSLGIRPRRQPALGDAVLAALRQSLYQSSTDERVYFGRLSRTYSLLFTLRTEPRLVRYFQEMAADFNLYVGADILVRALSERFVATEDQMTRNLLHLTREAGATLVLAEPVLEEVVNHLRVCDAEFRNFFAGMEERVTDDMARTIPKILLRAYFYAKLNSDLGSASPKSWASYVNQFCTYGELYRARAFEEVRMYLQAEFGMTFEARSLLEGLVSDEQVRELTERLAPRKAREELARNDALLALAVYGRREQLNEESTVSEFGLRTWWFTGETSIVRHTRDLVSGHGGTRYMMRPEFLLNFFALAPSLQEIRTAYSNVFPSLLGVRLARRMDEGAFHKLLENVREADNLDEGRKLAVISQLSDKLKADFTRQYVQEFAADA